jgi:hypothetical protein
MKIFQPHFSFTVITFTDLAIGGTQGTSRCVDIVYGATRILLSTFYRQKKGGTSFYPNPSFTPLSSISSVNLSFCYLFYHLLQYYLLFS